MQTGGGEQPPAPAAGGGARRPSLRRSDGAKGRPARPRRRSRRIGFVSLPGAVLAAIAALLVLSAWQVAAAMAAGGVPGELLAPLGGGFLLLTPLALVFLKRRYGRRLRRPLRLAARGLTAVWALAAILALAAALS